jgi:hypothetical protein
MAKASRKSTAKARWRRPSKKVPLRPYVLVGEDTHHVPLPRHETVANTRHYDEEDRANIRRHLKRVFAQWKTACKIDWEELWNKLETIANGVAWSAKLLADEPSFSRGYTLARLDETCKLIDALLQKLNLPDWRFISASTGLFGYDSPSNLIGGLPALRDELAARADDLRESFTDQRPRSYNEHDCAAVLKEIMFAIGQDLLGSVAQSRAPIIEFVRLALLPVLGDATPNGEALRKFAEDHLGPAPKRAPPSS